MSRLEKWEDLWQDRSNSNLPCYSLYVSNLPISTKAKDLKRVFENEGDLISVNVILDPKTGLSRGYGFVDYTTDESREKARSKYHLHEINGKSIRVSRSCGKCTLYVGNLPQCCVDEEDAIQWRLEGVSDIPIRRIRKKKTYNYCFVEYENHRQAQAALISLRNCVIDNSELRVEIAASESIHDRPRNHYSSHRSSNYNKNNSTNNDNDDDDDDDDDLLDDQVNEKKRTLYIKNLDKSTTDSAFQKVFEKFGKLTRCLIIRDIPSRKLNYGFVQYESLKAADNAYYELHGRKLNGVTLHIEFSKTLPGERKRRIMNESLNGNGNNNNNGSTDQKFSNKKRNGSSSPSIFHSKSRSRSPMSRSRSRSISRSRSRSRSRRHRHHRHTHRHHHHSRKRHAQKQHKHHHSRNNRVMPSRSNSSNNDDLITSTSTSNAVTSSGAVPMCVNLPMQYNVNEHLIGYNLKENKYILFAVMKTSSSLTKLQSISTYKKRSVSSRSSRSRSRTKKSRRRSSRKKLKSKSRSRSMASSRKDLSSPSPSPSKSVSASSDTPKDDDANGNNKNGKSDDKSTENSQENTQNDENNNQPSDNDENIKQI